MDERINSEHFNLDLKGQSLFIYPREGRGVVGNQMVFMGNGGGLDYTLIQSIRGGTVEN